MDESKQTKEMLDETKEVLESMLDQLSQKYDGKLKVEPYQYKDGREGFAIVKEQKRLAGLFKRKSLKKKNLIFVHIPDEVWFEEVTLAPNFYVKNLYEVNEYLMFGRHSLVE